MTPLIVKCDCGCTLLTSSFDSITLVNGWRLTNVKTKPMTGVCEKCQQVCANCHGTGVTADLTVCPACEELHTKPLSETAKALIDVVRP